MHDLISIMADTNPNQEPGVTKLGLNVSLQVTTYYPPYLERRKSEIQNCHKECLA